MHSLEKKVLNILTDLKENHNILGIKAEFEDEGASLEEIFLLKNLARKVNLELTVKIGGCGALNDANQTKNIGAEIIVAPMIESPYALKKFIQTVNLVYKESKPKLFANIETITGYENFDEIMSIEETKEISGIVVGRFDMAKSLGLVCKDCNGERLFNIVNDLVIKTKKLNKIFAVGGGITDCSIEFFKKMDISIDKFETRKIIFDAKTINDKNIVDGILKAIDFEIEWIKLRNEIYGIFQDKDIIRIQKLQTRSENFSSGSNVKI